VDHSPSNTARVVPTMTSKAAEHGGELLGSSSAWRVMSEVLAGDRLEALAQVLVARAAMASRTRRS
jgi:hypothetical protein